jgi:hypothetical protein
MKALFNETIQIFREKINLTSAARAAAQGARKRRKIARRHLRDGRGWATLTGKGCVNKLWIVNAEFSQVRHDRFQYSH